MMRPYRSFVRRRRGFSLIELVVAAVLSTLLMSLLAISWVAFGRPALEVEARARIAQEAVLATQSIACDLGGFLADTPGQTGTLAQYQFVDWNLSNSGVFLLNFQGANPGDVIVITYQLSGNQLVRSNSSNGVSTTIAKYVTAFSVTENPNNTSQALIQITIAFRYFSATYTLIGVPPS
jgi:prepilin-type N-terminal cleavage/methylation domain-containing protein